MRSVALADFDFSCATPVKVLDIHEGSGEVARRFADYTPEANRRLVSSSYGKVRSVIPVRPEELEMTLAQPDRTVCGARQ